MTLLKIRNTSNNPLPSYQTAGASGMDLHANLSEPVTLGPLERTLIPTGLYVEIPEGFEGQIRARSGLSIKHGLTLINAIGTIDSDYRGELKIPMVNLSNESFTIEHGERVCQLVIMPFERVELREVEVLEESERGVKGFGSTGK